MEANDKKLQMLIDNSKEFVDAINGDLQYAALLIGGKTTEVEPGEMGFAVAINVVGAYEILEGVLYSELANQIDEGSVDLFITINNVINAIKTDYGISDADLEVSEDTSNMSLH